MYGFNWGNQSPEEKAARDRAELMLLAEQAAFAAARAAGIAVGNGGSVILVGEEGRSALMLYADGAANAWKITCAVWPLTQPASTPYLSEPVATGVGIAYYQGNTIIPVDGGGYLVAVRADEGGDYYSNILFIDAKGKLIDKVTIVGASNTYDTQAEEGLFTGVSYLDETTSRYTVKLWSGGQVFTHSFPDATALPTWNASGVGGYDCTVDGTTTLRYSSNSGQQTWMLNATTGAKHNITQHLVHSNAAGQSDVFASGLSMYGNYLWRVFEPAIGTPQAIYASITQGSNQATVIDLFGSTPRVGQDVISSDFPQGTVVLAINGNTITLSQASTRTDLLGATIGLTGLYVDLLRIIKTDGTVTNIDLSSYNLRSVNEVIEAGKHDLIIEAVTSGHSTIPGHVIVYRGLTETLMSAPVNMSRYTNAQVITSNPQEFLTDLADPAGAYYSTVITYNSNTQDNTGIMTEHNKIGFMWFGPASTEFCTQEFICDPGQTFGLNTQTEQMQRQVFIGKMPISGEASIITLGLNTNLCDVISVAIPTAYANMTSNFQVNALGSTHALISWEDTSRTGDIRAYQIWNRVTMEWNGSTLWLDPTGVTVNISASTLLIRDAVGGNTYYWVPAINSGNAGILILADSLSEAPKIVGEGSWSTSIGSYSNFTQSGIMLVPVSTNEAWLIKNQAGQTATSVQLSGGFDWTNARINYDVIVASKEISDEIWIQVSTLTGQQLYTINTGFQNLQELSVTQNRVLARVTYSSYTRYYFISASGYTFKNVDNNEVVVNDWRWYQDWY